MLQREVNSPVTLLTPLSPGIELSDDQTVLQHRQFWDSHEQVIDVTYKSRRPDTHKVDQWKKGYH